MFVYPYSPSKYYRRHRVYRMPDGTQKDVLTSRYSYELFRRPAKGPRGGRALRTCARNLYYSESQLWQARNLEVEAGQWIHTLVPFEGIAWDAHAEQSRQEGVGPFSVECVEGVIVSVATQEEGREVWSWGESVEELETLLKLNCRRRKSPTK